MGQAGYNGTVTISPSTVVKGINTFELPYQLNTTDTTSFSQDDPGYEDSTPTTIGMDGKMSGFRITSDTGQNALRSAMLNRTLLTLIFAPDGGGETHTFPAWITSFAPKSEVNGVSQLDISFKMNGAPTIADS